MKYFVISDTHFGHNKIIEYCNRPPNHDEMMIRNWRDTVSPDDIVLHLGDVAMYKGVDLMPKDLPGKKILIRGNHDHLRDSKYYEMGFDFICNKIVLVIHREVVTLSHKPQVSGSAELNVHGHLHNLASTMANPCDVNHINVSVEQTNYYPVPLEDLVLQWKTFKNKGLLVPGDGPLKITMEDSKPRLEQASGCQVVQATLDLI